MITASAAKHSRQPLTCKVAITKFSCSRVTGPASTSLKRTTHQHDCGPHHPQCWRVIWPAKHLHGTFAICLRISKVNHATGGVVECRVRRQNMEPMYMRCLQAQSLPLS